MTKAEFIEQLSTTLKGLSDEDIKKSLDYYEEMIDDRMEDGKSEEEAVGGLGTIDEIKDAMAEVGFTDITSNHDEERHFIIVIGRKP